MGLRNSDTPMTPTRRQKIEAMLVDDPADQFLRYSLALELEKEAQHDASLNHLSSLQRDAKPYVPAFFMAAQQLTRLNRLEDCALDLAWRHR